jgi:hypothetical protein
MTVVRVLVGFLRRSLYDRALCAEALPPFVRHVAGRPPVQLCVRALVPVSS